MNKKPSEIFEGENSSLRKTYDNAVQKTQFCTHLGYNTTAPCSESCPKESPSPSIDAIVEEFEMLYVEKGMTDGMVNKSEWIEESPEVIKHFLRRHLTSHGAAEYRRGLKENCIAMDDLMFADLKKEGGKGPAFLKEMLEKEYQRGLQECFSATVKDNGIAADYLKQLTEDAYQKGKKETVWEFINAFAEYVPLGAEDADPKVMAKNVITLWGEKEYEKGQQSIIEKINELRNEVINRKGPNDTDMTRLAELSLFAEISNIIKSLRSLEEGKLTINK